MRLATLNDGSKDGRLILLSPDGAYYAQAPLATLQAALDGWDAAAATLAAVTDFPNPLDPSALTAPLPRAWQWLDGSAFSTHGDLMQVAFGLDPINTDKPLMYQGVRIGFSARPKVCRCPLSNMVLILKASSVLL